MGDPLIRLHRLPHLRRVLLDRKVPTVGVRKPNGLGPEVVVQVRLLRVFQPEICRLQLGRRIFEDPCRGAEEEDPGVETCREPTVIYLDIRDGSEFERGVPEFAVLRTIVSASRHTAGLRPIRSSVWMLSFVY